MNRSRRALIIGQTTIKCPTTGAQLRNYYLARALARVMDVQYVGFEDINPIAGLRTPIIEDAPLPSSIQVEEIVRERGYTAGKLLRGAVGRTPVTVLNYTSPLMMRRVNEVLDAQHVDIVQMEGVHLAGYVPMLRKRQPRALLSNDWHNIESELMQRYSEQPGNLLRRLYARRTAGQLRDSEDVVLRGCDLQIMVSDRERDALAARYSGTEYVVIENGVDTDYFRQDRLQSALAASPVDARLRSVVFVGAMDYHANVNAVTWFAGEMWPRILQADPDCRFRIIGRNPAPAVQALGSHPGIEVTGAVPDVRPYYAAASVVAVPLRLGAGTRLKILEAMAAGVPMVSTAIGAEGLAVNAGEHMLIADSPDEFAGAVIALLRDENRRATLAANARRFAKERYDWESIGGALADRYLEMLARQETMSAMTRS